MNAAEVGKRLAVLVAVVAVVLAAVGAGAVVSQRGGGDDGGESFSVPEYQPENVNAEPIPAEGEIRPDDEATTESGTVLIDDAHGNRYARADIQPMVEALTRVGYDVEFYTGGELSAELEDAKAFVVIDPASEFRPGDIDDIRRFTGQGGRLLMVGEPDRIAVGGGFFGASIVNQESRLTTLASRYGMSVDTAYLYNQESADANYKWITTRPGENADIEGVERTTMYTAAAVRTNGGRVLLRSAANTQRADSDDAGRYPVAVRRGDVILLGDKSFMNDGRFRVADNEAFVTYLVEFLASGEREPGTTIPDPDEETDSGGGSAGSAAPESTAAPPTGA